jgi:hypothetical protein
MRRIINSFYAIVALVALAQMAQAQVFYSEDFSDGAIPAGWTTTDGSPNGVLWQYCDSPGAGCPGNLNGFPGYLGPTASNGFMILDSDAAGDIPSNHISRLTTAAINCSAANQVYALFNNYVGVFEVPSTGNVVLRVSTDNNNWTEYDVVPGLSVSNRFSDNPHKAAINISSVAANKATVYLQWEWTGHYEYWWILDDLELTSADPTAPNDLKMSSYFYTPASFATPVSQIASDTFSFFGFVSNLGAATQTNVELKAEILKEDGSVVFADSASIASLDPGVLDSFIETPNRFVPDLEEGLYFLRYTTSSDGVDATPSNNVATKDFFVSDFIFSKENGPTTALRPGTGGDYAVGNLYRMNPNSLEKYRALGYEVSGATNPSDIALADAAATAYLFKINSDVAPDLGDFDPADFLSASMELLGLTAFDYPDGAENFSVYPVVITDAASGAEGVLLEAGASYLAVMGYQDASNVVFHATSTDYLHPYFVSSAVYTDQWYLGGFGDDYNPVLRMFIELVSTTDESALPESVMTVFPNPAQDVLNLEVSFDNATDASITIADINGRVIKMDDRSGLTKEVLTYQIPQLAAGTYLVRIATKEGTKTKKFVVAK